MTVRGARRKFSFPIGAAVVVMLLIQDFWHTRWYVLLPVVALVGAIVVLGLGWLIELLRHKPGA